MLVWTVIHSEFVIFLVDLLLTFDVIRHVLVSVHACVCACRPVILVFFKKLVLNKTRGLFLCQFTQNLNSSKFNVIARDLQ